MSESIILINSSVSSGGDSWLSFDSVPVGEVWKITKVAAINHTSRFNGIEACVNHQHEEYGWLQYYFYKNTNSINAMQLCCSGEEIYLEGEDYIDIVFRGCKSGDVLEIYAFGCKEEDNDGQLI